MSANALVAYPDHNKRFNVYTDASDYQVGTCIAKWLTLKLMKMIITNYETVYSSIGFMSHDFFLESPLFRDGGI
jgi:hypothetical protein